MSRSRLSDLAASESWAAVRGDECCLGSADGCGLMAVTTPTTNQLVLLRALRDDYGSGEYHEHLNRTHGLPSSDEELAALIRETEHLGWIELGAGQSGPVPAARLTEEGWRALKAAERQPD